MWRARMKERLWVAVHKELDDEWRSWRPDGVIKTYFTNCLPYTIVTNETDFMSDPPEEDGWVSIFPAEIYDYGHSVVDYKELEYVDGDESSAVISYSYRGWLL